MLSASQGQRHQAVNQLKELGTFATGSSVNCAALALLEESRLRNSLGVCLDPRSGGKYSKPLCHLPAFSLRLESETILVCDSSATRVTKTGL